MDINTMSPQSGRRIREDNSIINEADIISSALGGKTYAFEQVTVADTAKTLTAATYGLTKRAVITVETAQIRFRTDGTAPTAAVGHLLDAGDTVILESAEDIANFKAIRTGTVSAVINASYSS